MSNNFYWMEFLVRERISSKFQEAEAAQLANIVGANRPTHPSMLKSVGQALKKVTQVVQAVIYRRNRQSPVPRQ
jgi:hypothetical protein